MPQPAQRQRAPRRVKPARPYRDLDRCSIINTRSNLATIERARPFTLHAQSRRIHALPRLTGQVVESATRARGSHAGRASSRAPCRSATCRRKGRQAQHSHRPGRRPGLGQPELLWRQPGPCTDAHTAAVWRVRAGVSPTRTHPRRCAAPTATPCSPGVTAGERRFNATSSLSRAAAHRGRAPDDRLALKRQAIAPRRSASGTSGTAATLAWTTPAVLTPGPLEIGFDYHFAVPTAHGDPTGVFVENHRVVGLKPGPRKSARAQDPLPSATSTSG